MKEVHKLKTASVSKCPSSKKYQEIVEIKKTAATKETEAQEKRKDAKAQAERENAAAAEANRTLQEAEAQETERRSMKSSCTETNRRGVSALSEHRRQDGWTSTPCTCGGSGCSGGCDELAGERLPKQRPRLTEGKKTKKKHVRRQQRKMKNILTAVLRSISVHDSHIRVMRQVPSCFVSAATRAK